jgi:Domain of unknown function (DUF4157)/Putative amidase domain
MKSLFAPAPGKSSRQDHASTHRAVTAKAGLAAARSEEVNTASSPRLPPRWSFVNIPAYPPSNGAVLQRKCDTCDEREEHPAAGGVLQLQSADTTPPAGASDEREREVSPGGTDILGDAGVTAEIDAGGPSGLAREEEESKGAPAAQAFFEEAQDHPAALSAPRVLASLTDGAPLEPTVGKHMSTFFGFDFSRVRVHTDRQAEGLASSLGAKAFTIGDHVAFGQRRYDPTTREGTELLAHELTHVVQQSRGLTGPIAAAGIGQPGDRYEREADAMAARAVDSVDPGGAAPPDATNAPAAPVVQAQPLPGAPAAGPAAPPSGSYNRSAAATYALIWAENTNPDYGRFLQDCTDFVSQALFAGGLSMIKGKDQCSEFKSNNVWWFEQDGCFRFPPFSNIRASYTWAGAPNLHDFLLSSGRGNALGSVADLELGDVLQTDYGDDQIKHSMMVTKKTPDNIWLSYHSNERRNFPFWGPKGFLELHRLQHPAAKFWPTHIG